MLPFPVELKPGRPIYEQVILAVKRALAHKILKPGDPFPSVRELSRELSINPNTAQKVVTALTQQSLIEVTPGRGCQVSNLTGKNKKAIDEILYEQLEAVIVEAITLGIEKDAFTDQVKKHWERLTKEKK